MKHFKMGNMIQVAGFSQPMAERPSPDGGVSAGPSWRPLLDVHWAGPRSHFVYTLKHKYSLNDP